VKRAVTDFPSGTRVTGVVPDPRRDGAVRIEVDGRPLLTVPAEIAVRLGIGVGGQLSGAVHQELCRAADAEAAFRTALRVLERRPFAVRDLSRRLVLKGHPPEAADQAVARAVGLGLVNDETYARHFIQTRSARGRGPSRLRRELTAMGVLPSLVDRLLSEELPEEQTLDRVSVLARKRASQLSGLPRHDRLRRVVAYLARRGYRGAEVVRVVREVCA
jgi:regulatory protein